MPLRPKSLTFIAVVAIVLGVTTALASLSNVLVAKMGSFGPSAMARQGGASGPSAAMVAAEVEFQRRTLEIDHRHHKLFLAVLPFAIIASVAMIVGGANALSLRRGSRPLLLAGMTVALILDLACAKPRLETQLEIADATSTMMTAMVQTVDAAVGDSRPAQSIIAATEGMTRMTATATVVMRIAISVAQLAFLVYGLVYLSRARTREVFAGR